MLLNLRKRNNSKIIFVRQDKIFFITSLPFFKKIVSFKKYTKFFIWRSINDHFLWRLRNISVKVLDLSSEFLNKFNNFNA